MDKPRTRWLTLLLVLIMGASAALVRAILDDEDDARRRPRPHLTDDDDDTPAPPDDEEAAAGRVAVGAVAGVTVDRGGALLGGVEVRCGGELTRGDASGRFRCPALTLPARLGAAAAGYAAVPTAAEAVVNAARDNLRLRLRRPATISGHVVDGTRPAVGATLRVEWLRSEGLDGAALPPFSAATAATTDAHGRFTLRGLWPGRLRVHASVPGRSAAISAPLDLDDGQREDGLLLRLGPGGTLSGTVRSRVGGGAIAGATIAIAGVHGGPEARSDAGGAFRLERLPAGEWTIEVRAAGHMSVRDAVRIVDHAVPSRLYELDPLPGVGGRVLDASGAAVVAADVYLRVGGRSCHVRSGPDGRFRLEDAPTQQGAVARATHPTHGDSDEVELLPGDDKVLQLGRPGRLEGSVVFADGRPAAGAVVRVVAEHHDGPDPDGAPSNRQRRPTDERGRFVFEHLRPGRFDLKASAPGAPPGVLRGAAVSAGGTTRVELRLDGGVVVEGGVLDAEANPTAAALTLRCADEPAMTTSSADDGRYRFVDAPPGRCTLSARAPEHILEVRVLSLPDSGRVVQDLRLRAAGAGEERALPRHGVALVEGVDGLVVSRVDPGTPAADAGLAVGDRVRGVDFRHLGEHDLDGVFAGAAESDGPITLEVEHGGHVETVYLTPRGQPPAR